MCLSVQLESTPWILVKFATYWTVLCSYQFDTLHDIQIIILSVFT